MGLFEAYYEHKIPSFRKEEWELMQAIKRLYPEEAYHIMSKLEERTRKLKDMFEMSRLRKYS